MKQQSKRRRLILFPLPLQGHINPMFQLATILHSRGFCITVIHTAFNSLKPSDHPEFTFRPISDGLSEAEASTTDLISLLDLINTKCADPFRKCLAHLLSEASEEEPIACLISDAILHFTGAVARGLNLPRVVLRTGGVSSFVAFAAFPLLLQKSYLPVQESRLEEPVPELPPLRVKDLPVINTGNPEILYKIVADMVRETKASSGVIFNSFEELEHQALTTLQKDFQIPIFPIGPFHKHFPAYSSDLSPNDQKSCISWLDKQAAKSVVYMSFGSIAVVDKAAFLEVAWGLANSGQPFLWVVRPGSVNESEWLDPLPNGFFEMVQRRGKIVKWAPQQQVLAHPAVGAFWTHNGWNSTLESVSEGVPMICTPCFTDQLVNARFVSRVWKIGLHLESGLERRKIERMIRRVLVGKEGEELKERATQLKEKVNQCVKIGGSSHGALESLISSISSF
ncbi:Cytokinin 7-beta-glucosyltransferase [Bertholletia excelsa]